MPQKFLETLDLENNQAYLNSDEHVTLCVPTIP